MLRQLRRDRQAALVEREVLLRLVAPWPFAGLVAEAQHRGRVARASTAHGFEPALAVERARVAGHVRARADLAAAEREAPAADAVDVGHEREAGRTEHVFAADVALAQDRRRGASSPVHSKAEMRRRSKGLAPAAAARRPVARRFSAIS